MSRLVGHDIRGILRVFELHFALGIEANLGLISYMVWKRSNRLGSRLTQSVGAIVPNVSGTLGSRLARVPFAVGDCMFVAGRTLLEAREPRQVMVDPTSSALSRLQARLRGMCQKSVDNEFRRALCALEWRDPPSPCYADSLGACPDFPRIASPSTSNNRTTMTA